MCFSSPDVKTPAPVQEQQNPDYQEISKARKKVATVGSGTLLTSPSGVSLQSQNFGGSSLLGS